MQSCFSFTAVLELIENGHPDAPHLESHLTGGCPSCERKAEDARTLLELLHRLKAVTRTERLFRESQTQSSLEILSSLARTVAAEQRAQQHSNAFLQENQDDLRFERLLARPELIHPTMVRSLCGMARKHLESDLKRVEAYLRVAESVWDEIQAQASGDDELIHAITHADLLLVKGILAKNRDDYQQAVTSFHEAAQLYLDSGLEDEVASVLIPWAGVLKSLGRLDEAERYYEKSLTIAELYSNTLNTAKAHFGLAILSLNRDDSRKGFLLLNKARQSFQKLNEIIFVGETFAIEGYYYREREEYEKALSCFEEATEQYLEANATFELARVKKNLGNIFQQLGDVEQACRYFDEASHIFQEQKAEILSVYVSLDKALLLSSQGFLDDGRCIALSALEFFSTHELGVGIEWAEEKLQQMRKEPRSKDILVEVLVAMRQSIEAALPLADSAGVVS